MKADKKAHISIIILTGLSGAGKTVALNAFEDSGFFCIDNLPVSLIENFIKSGKQNSGVSKVAIGVDIRERKFLTDFSEKLSALRKKYNIKILFLESTDEALIRRFKETRRPHPLGSRDLTKAITREIRLLSDLRKDADKIIDTSAMTPHQLRRYITQTLLKKGPREMIVHLLSFGYKFGIPLEADLLLDVRFLPNPYFIQDLKALPGTSAKVRKFVLSHKDTRGFFDHFYPLLDYMLPFYKKEGRSYLTIGIGCTGGRHRSPAIVQEIEKTLKKQKLKTTVTHRDLDHSP